MKTIYMYVSDEIASEWKAFCWRAKAEQGLTFTKSAEIAVTTHMKKYTKKWNKAKSPVDST